MQKMQKRMGFLALSFVLGALMTSAVWADPLPGQVPKFLQPPMLATPITNTTGTTIYPGHDELSTAWHYPTDAPGVYRGTFMADDFADKVSTPVVHLSWWGSYMNVNAATPPQQVQKFLIAFESDVAVGDPANPYTWSNPGSILNSQIVTFTPNPLTPGSGQFTEKLVSTTNPAEPVYKYNAELSLPFNQQKDTVYWLKIVALDDPVPGVVPMQWGWHNRDYTLNNPLASSLVSPGETQLNPSLPLYHFQDDAVQGHISIMPNAAGGMNINQFYANVPPEGPQNYVPGLDGPSYVGQYSKDLAFELYTVPVPEPATWTLLGMGIFGLAVYGWRKRKQS
jgi:hypothetical protein